MPITNNNNVINKTGCLYVVATPIGNMADITLRAVEILKTADIIAAEDTRRTGNLLRYYEVPQVKSRLISYGEHNEDRRTGELIKEIKKGRSIALVSDAGTPSVSDPGYRLITAAIRNGAPVIPVPGVSAVNTALSVAGLPTDTYIFVGFLAKGKTKRLAQLRSLAKESRTMVFFESPKRIRMCIRDVIAIMGDRYGVLCREMTKLHEEYIRDLLSEIVVCLDARIPLKGECTLLVSGYRVDIDAFLKHVLDDLREELKTGKGRFSEIVNRFARIHGLPRHRIYQEALKIRNDLQGKRD